MAIANCGSITASGFRYYANGWNSSTNSDKYLTNRITVYTGYNTHGLSEKITLPSFNNTKFTYPYTLNVSIPVLYRGSCTLYVYLCTTDPTQGAGNYSRTPTPTQEPPVSYIGSGSVSYSSESSSVVNWVPVNISISNTDLTSGQTCYLWVQTSARTKINYGGAAPEGTLDGTITTFTVTYDANGGTGAPASQTKAYGTNLTLTSEVPKRTGYTFLGWSTSSSATTATWKKGGTYSTEASNTLYAVWSINSYTLYIYPQGGTWDSSTSSQNFSLKYNATKSISVPTRTGYTFGGWAWSAYGSMSNSSFKNSILSSSSHGIKVYDSSNSGFVTHTHVSDASDKPLCSNDHITITKNTGTASPGLGGFYNTVTPEYNTTYIHTFYAKLPAGFYFSYHYNPLPTGSTISWITDNKGTGSWRMYGYKIVTGSSGSTGTFGHIAANADSGDSNTAVTWYLGANQITKSPTSAQTFTMAAGDSWIYALWLQNKYTITFNANGGDAPNIASKSVSYDDTYGALATVSRTGYTFAGWYTSASGGTKITSSTKVQITENQTLYAHWTVNSYTLTLTTGTGISAVSGAGTYDYNQSISINATVKTGYTWKNWTKGTTTTELATTKNYTFNMPNTNTTYKANATANTWYIQYNGNGAASGSMSKSTHTYDTAKNLSANVFVRPGYEFLGWSTSVSGEVEYTDKESVKNLTSTNGKTVSLYAIWKPLSQLFIWHEGAWHRALRYTYTTS